MTREVLRSFGEAKLLARPSEESSRFPLCHMCGPVLESVAVGDELDRPLPDKLIPCAPISIERSKDYRVYNYVVRFPSEF